MWLLLLCCGTGWSHELPVPEVEFDRIGVGDGLSNGAVNAIIQDSDGFMWFGTQDGLNRYDGKRFVIHRHEPGNPNSLSSSNFGTLMEDSAGRLWLGTWGGGVNWLDRESGRFTRLSLNGQDRGSGRERVEFLFEDSLGNVWIGTERSGLKRFDPVSATFEHYSHVPNDPFSLGSDSVKAIEESADGRLWIGTDAGLFVLQRERNRFQRVSMPGAEEQGSERIRSLRFDGEGSLWIGTRGDGLKRLDLATGSWSEFRHSPAEENGLSENSVARVFVDSSGIVWIATYDSGLDRLDPASGEFRNFDYAPADSDQGVSFRRIDVIYEDRTGVLWFGTRGGGINKLAVRPKGFRNYRYEAGAQHRLPHATVRSITGQATATGELLWIGTDGGLARLELPQGHIRNYEPQPGRPGALQDGRVWATLADSAGRIWAGTYSSGLFLMVSDAGAGEFRRFVNDPGRSDSLSSNSIRVLLEDREGAIWVGTDDGLNRLRAITSDSSSFERIALAAGDSPVQGESYITALLEASDGSLWVGTPNGLHVLDRESGIGERFEYKMDDPETLSSSDIASLYEDALKRIWVGTAEAGLNRFEASTRKFTRYPELSARIGQRVASIRESGDGQLWLGTAKGLARFSPGNGASRIYAKTDGLRTLSFLQGAAHVTRSGDMFFGGLRGMVSFRPAGIVDNMVPPPLVFTSVTRFDTGAELLGAVSREYAPLTLEHDGAFIRFEYAALDFMHPEGNQYAHMMQGVDTGWIHTGNQNSVSYSGLRPGDYVFRVRAANSDGAWTEQAIELALTVMPAYWQTWWFRVLATLAITMLVLLAYLVRTRSIRAQNLQLEKLNVRLTDQISERNRAEREREELIRELKARNEEMERFTYSVSHDLKSPLITIQGFLGLLRQDHVAGDEARVTSDIEKIESSTEKMHQLLDELLLLSRAGKTVDEIKEVGFGSIVSDALGLTRGEIEKRGIIVKVQESLPTIRADRVRLTEAMSNLISNAARFMGDQLHPVIEIGAEDRDGLSIFFVRDNGQGIERKHHERIFGLFERLDPDLPGTGIGLALVRRVVETHGGRVWVESEGPGRGSTFCFTLGVEGAARVSEAEPVRAAS